MASSDRMIGFSTGALAKGDFRKGISLLRDRGVKAIELSALREDELPMLMQSLGQLDLSGFEYVSVHSPTRMNHMHEKQVIDLLGAAIERKLPIIVHPDVMQSPEQWWQHLGNLLVVENMDKRKPNGRTTEELGQVINRLPDAGFCFDVAHAGQVDPTMTEAAQMLRHFGSRLRQVHASGVTTASGHSRLSATASLSISRVAHLISMEVPIILESPVEEESILGEIEFARRTFSPWLERLRAEIDSIFGLRIRELRRNQAASFLQTLQMTGTKLSDFEVVISNLPSGSPYQPGDVMLSSRELLNKLSDAQKGQLQAYLLAQLHDLAMQFPDLKREFADQFSGIETFQAT